MPAPSGNKAVAVGPNSRLSKLGIALPAPPTPLGAYVESSDAGNLLFALAAAKEHLGDLDRLKKLIKLTVLIATTEMFAEHAQVADGASNLFAQIFGPQSGHVRLVYGVYSLPIGAPVIVDAIFEIEPVRQSPSKPHQY